MSPMSRPALPDEAPQGLRALKYAMFWLVLGVAAGWGSVLVVVHVLSTPWRIIGATGLGLLGILALMLASDSLERWLAGRLSRWRGRVFWFALSLVALAVVVVIGAPLTLSVRDRPGFSTVLVDFVLDVVVGALGGAVAVGLVLLFSSAFGGLIYTIECRLELPKRANRWRAPHAAERLPWGHVARGAALGAAGLVMSAVCTAVITTFGVNRAGAADAPATVERGAFTVLVPLLFWFVGARVGWILSGMARGRRRGRDSVGPHPRLRHGTHATALAVCLMVVWVSVAAGGLQTSTERSLWRGRHAVPAVPITPQHWSRQSMFLAQHFEPRFWLTTREQWSPTSVAWYTQQSGGATKATTYCNTGDGCYHISRKGCDGSDPPRSCTPSGVASPALYYRYFDSSDLGAEAEGASTSWRLIEYWIFYNYDSLAAGPITQWHQADWEQVSVLVQRRGESVRPIEVAFSEHCYGAVIPANRVEWSDGPHPVVFVGQGSHADYPRPVSVPVRQLRCSLGLEPRYFGVAGLFFAPAFDGANVELPLAYLIGLRDRAARARMAPSLPLLPIDDATGVWRFRGAWGLDNNISLIHVSHLTTGAGPPAPQTQAPWLHPICDMLLSGRWLSPGVRITEPGWKCSSG